MTPPAATSTPVTFRRGDVNADGAVDISDLPALTNYLALSQPISCLAAADVNDDGAVDYTDLSYWSSWFNLGGPAPKSPGPSTAGVDPTADSLGCAKYPR